MKLAFVGPAHPYRGGIAHYMGSLVDAAIDAGHQVAVYNFSRQYPGLLFPGASQLDPSSDPVPIDSIRSIDSLNPLSWLSTGRRIGRLKPDLVVVQWWHPYFAPSFGTISRLLSHRRDTTVVFLCHNVLPHESNVLDRALLRYAFGSADAFVVQAQCEQEKLVALLGRDTVVEVAPHPVYDRFTRAGSLIDRDAARRQLNIGASRVLLFFGLIRPYKGLDVLIDALPLMTTGDLHLVIAGECYGDPHQYLARIEDLGLSRRVSFIDRYLADEEVPLFFSAADVAVLPYRSATGSGIVQVAYAFGVPVIVSAVGGIPEVVAHGETGLLVPPGDPEALASAVDQFFGDELAGPLRAGIAARTRTTGWDNVVKALERCRQRHLERRHRPC